MKNIQYSSGGIILNSRSEIVLVKEHPNGDSWSFPKGHIEENETPLDAAKREVYEETGLSVLEFIKDLGSYKCYVLNEKGEEDKSKPKVVYLFLFSTTKPELHMIDNNIADAKWFKQEDVAIKLKSPSSRKYFLKILKDI